MRSGLLEGATFCGSKAGLATAGGATTFATTVDLSFCIRGRGYFYALAAGVTSPVIDGNTGKAFIALNPDEACLYLWCINAANGFKVCQGPVVKVDSDFDIRLWDPQYPAVPDGYCPFGYTIIQSTGALSGGWTFGSSNWNKAGTTKLTGDLLCLPDRLVHTATA